MYSIQDIVRMREESEREMEMLQASQDGSHAIKNQAVFVGGRYSGSKVDHDTLMKMGNGKFTIRWSALKQHNPLLVNPNLEDQPMVDGYLSPMWDGGILRYETQEVYNMLSN